MKLCSITSTSHNARTFILRSGHMNVLHLCRVTQPTSGTLLMNWQMYLPAAFSSWTRDAEPTRGSGTHGALCTLCYTNRPAIRYSARLQQKCTTTVCAGITHTQANTLQYTQSHTWWFGALKVLPHQLNGFIGGMTHDALPLHSA